MNTIYDQIRSLTPEQLQAAWITTLKKGDEFKLNKDCYAVTVHTNTTFRLKKNGKENYTFKLFNNLVVGEGRLRNLLLDAEGVLIVDLLNQYNKFHTNSDIFRLTESAFIKNTE